ncbi:hypothetical protein [Nocardia sp. NPDC058705]|uniref:hypothetical protein n=1 Tax=Nocardia sp. NPDC058705 TaxID=3346609 RepID=UPI0036C5CBAC
MVHGEGKFVAGPDLMVATVGLNPVPVVLAVLTRKPDRVILVHSTESAAVSIRIAALISSLTDMLAPEVDRWDCGGAEGFSSTLESFKRLADEMLGGADTYLLDYSGGNKIMTACAVWMHLRHHCGGGERQRSYVDNQTGMLVTGSAEDAALTVVNEGLTLSNLAELHGYVLDDIKLDWQRARTVEVADVRSLIVDVDRERPQVVRLQERLARLTHAAGIESRWLDEAFENKRRAREKVQIVKGLARELLAVCLLAPLVDDGVEAMFSVSVTDPTRPGQRRLAELDLLVRQGHRVLHVEVKSSAEGARKELGQRTAFSRLVFGSAAETATAATEGFVRHNGCDWEALTTKREELTRAAPWLGKVSIWRLEADSDKGVEFAAGLRNWLATAPDPGAVGNPGPAVKSNSAVVPAIGTKLAVIASLERVGDLSDGDVVGVGNGDPARNSWYFDRCEDLGVEADEEVTVLRGFSEAATVEFVPEAAAAMVTPGPKGVTAGLVRAVYAGNGTVGHVGLDGRLHTFSGTEDPMGEEHAPAAGYSARWADVLDGRFDPYVKQDGARKSVRSVADLLRACLADTDVEFWWPVEPRVKHVRDPRPELLITGRYGCCSVNVLHLPEGEYPSPGKIQAQRERGDAQKKLDNEVKRYRFGVLSASAEAANMLGDAHRPLVVLHNRRGARALGNRKDIVRATLMSHSDNQWERFAEIDRWLPLGLWSDADVPAVLIDREAVIQHLNGHQG